MGELMIESSIVFVVIGMVVVLGVRSIYRYVKGDRAGKCCGCSSCTCDDAKRSIKTGSLINMGEKEV